MLDFRNLFRQFQQGGDGDLLQCPCYVSVLVIQSRHENRRAAIGVRIVISLTLACKFRTCLRIKDHLGSGDEFR